MIHCTDRLHFAYLFIRGWTFKLFLPLPVINGAAVNIHGEVFKADSLKFFYDSLLLNSRINLGLNLLFVQPSVLLMALRLCLCPPSPFICWINIFQDELSISFSMTTGIAPTLLLTGRAPLCPTFCSAPLYGSFVSHEFLP